MSSRLQSQHFAWFIIRNSRPLSRGVLEDDIDTRSTPRVEVEKHQDILVNPSNIIIDEAPMEYNAPVSLEDSSSFDALQSSHRSSNQDEEEEDLRHMASKNTRNQILPALDSPLGASKHTVDDQEDTGAYADDDFESHDGENEEERDGEGDLESIAESLEEEELSGGGGAAQVW